MAEPTTGRDERSHPAWTAAVLSKSRRPNFSPSRVRGADGESISLTHINEEWVKFAPGPTGVNHK